MTAKGSHEQDSICLVQAEAEEGPLAGDQSQANPHSNQPLTGACKQHRHRTWRIYQHQQFCSQGCFFLQSWAVLRAE